MTYRNLERLLLVLGMLVLIGVWLSSLTSVSSVSFQPARGGAFGLGVYSGTVAFLSYPDGNRTDRFSANRVPLSNFPPESFDRYQLEGGFCFKKMDMGPAGSTYLVAMPLWVAYFAFLGSVAILIHRMRMRSTAMKERMLAEQAAAADREPHGAEPMSHPTRP